MVRLLHISMNESYNNNNNNNDKMIKIIIMKTTLTKINISNDGYLVFD